MWTQIIVADPGDKILGYLYYCLTCRLRTAKKQIYLARGRRGTLPRTSELRVLHAEHTARLLCHFVTPQTTGRLGTSF